MTYRVIYSPSVRDDIREHVRYLTEQHVSGETIERWYDRFFDLVHSLDQMPKRFAIDEKASRRHGFEVRKVIHGDFVIRYRVDDGRRVVEVLSLRHGARRT